MRKLCRSLKIYFSSDFDRYNFGYVLLPFARIFKACGLLPVHLRGGDILRQPPTRLQWDWTAWAWTLLASIVYIGGFVVGIHHEHFRENWARLQRQAPIAYCTNLAQIFALFLLGGAAVVNSWTHLDELQQLCTLIFRIDRQLRRFMIARIDYGPVRRRLLTQLAISFAIPLLSSMVNCVIIQPPEVSFVYISSCYWFICFTPILLLTFKQFQFCNWMILLKSKFDIINEKLGSFQAKASRHKFLYTSPSTDSDIPLAALSANNTFIHSTPIGSAHCETPRSSGELIDFDTLQQLLSIYSTAADCADLVMKYFAWHLVLFTAVSFAIITIQSYNLFALLVNSLQMQPYQVAFVVAWIAVQITSIGLNVYSCEITTQSMTRTGPLLHKLKLYCSINGGRVSCLQMQLLQLFSMEVLQRSRNYTAAGFFDLNAKLITSILGAVTTYLVIIIQFHLTSLPEMLVTRNAAPSMVATTMPPPASEMAT